MERCRDGIGVASSLALIAAPAAAAPPATPAFQHHAAATPGALWRDLTGVGITCLVHTPRGVDTGALHARLCEAVRARAAVGAPVPVTIATLGGEALAPGRVTLFVQAGVSTVRGAPVMALSIRPFRNVAEAGQFFAAAPHAVAPDDRAALNTAIRAMLADTLPWQAGTAAGARQIPQP